VQKRPGADLGRWLPLIPCARRPRGRPRKVAPTYPVCPQKKRPRGRPRKVAGTIGASAGGAPVGGHVIQRNTNKEAALGFAGCIGVMQKNT
jgi:hypothetical protein